MTALPPSEGGWHDVFGNAWEWGEDHFAAFPGFRVHPYYDDFSAPCFGGLHQLVRSLAWAHRGPGAALFLCCCELRCRCPRLLLAGLAQCHCMALHGPVAACMHTCSMQILGGSFISTGQLASKYARYQFRAHFFQHASFRLVQSADVDLTAYGAVPPLAPVLPFFETSCMDAAEPYVGDAPCCSKARHDRYGARVVSCVSCDRHNWSAGRILLWQ